MQAEIPTTWEKLVCVRVHQIQSLPEIFSEFRAIMDNLVKLCL